MFGLFKKKDSRGFAHEIKIDMHSHLIPGIDDGAKDMEHSIELITHLKEMGYTKLITTPHMMEDSYPNTPQIIQDGLSKLKQELRNRGIEIEIEAAAEHYLDEAFLEKLEQGRVLSFGDGYLLFETSYVSKPMNMEEMIYEIGLKGYKPVLAHPERYRYIKDLESEYSRLKELGVLFQTNINSLGGYYGKEAKRKGMFLLEKGWINFLGSDTHHMKHIDALRETAQNNSLYNKLLKKNTLLNHTLLS